MAILYTTSLISTSERIAFLIRLAAIHKIYVLSKAIQ